MRWVRYSVDGGTACVILEGERIAQVAGDPFAGFARTGHHHALSGR